MIAIAIRIFGWLLTPILFLFWKVITLLPESFAYQLARPVGIIIRMRTRERTLRTMKIVVGCQEWNDDQWMHLWTKHAEQIALMIIELARFDTMPTDEMRRRITIQGEELLCEALQAKRGVIVYMNHLGNLASAMSILALRGYDLTLVGNPVWIPFLEKKIQRLHTKVGAHRLPIGNDLPREAAHVFHRNGIFATFIDFSVTRKHTTWLQFGKADLRVNVAPAILALRHNVAILSATCTRLPANRHHVVLRPLQFSPTGDIHTDTVRLMQQAIRHVEEDLFVHPEQWWPWNYARIRPREPAEESIPISPH